MAEGERLKAESTRETGGTKLRQEEQGWSEGMDWKSCTEADAVGLRD